MPTLDIIKDPVTGNQYSRDTSNPTSTYAPYQGSTLLPKVDTAKPVDAAKLNVSPMPTPPAVKSTAAQDSLSANVASVADSAFSNQQQAAQEAQTPVPAQKNGLQSVLDKIMGDSSLLGNKGKRTLEIQDAEGVNTKKKAQTDLENQILSKTRTYDKQIQAVQNQPGILTDVASARIGQIERQKNAELADLAIQYKVAQDDYQGAVEIAQAKVEAEFEPIQNEIDTLKTYYQLAQNDMTESEKLQAQAAIQAKQDDKDFAQQKELALYNARLNPIKIGAGDTLYDPVTGEITTFGDGTVDNTTLSAYAQQAAASGQLPSATDLKNAGLTAGQVMQAAKELPKQDGTLVDSQTGLKPSNQAMSDTQQAGAAALYDLTKKLNEAESLFKDVQTTNGTGLVTGTLGSIFPNDKVQAYNTLKGEIIDLLARARSGAALTEYEEQQYASKLPGLFNKTAFVGKDGVKSIQNLRSSISGKLDTTLNTFGASIYGYSKVNIKGQTYTIGEKVQAPNGAVGTVLPDGTISTPDAQSGSSGGVSVNIPPTSRLAYVNNNPGNLRYVGQQGAQPGEGGFARFPSPAAGFKALVNQVRTDAGRGLSITSFISKFAPPSENDTKKYIRDVVAMLGVSPATLISKIDPVKVAKAMAKKESSSIIA